MKHDRVIQEFRFLATSGGNRTETHNLDLFRELDPGNGLKPDILLYGVGTNGCNVLMDATFGDPRGQTNVDKAWNTRGHVINTLNGKKVAKYGHLCDAIGIEFHPAAFEIFGSTSDATETLIARMVARAAEKNHIPYPNLLSYWRKRISTCIQLGNVDLLFKAFTRILTRSDDFKPPSAEAFLQEVLRS